MTEFQGKVIAITGAASGIGLALTRTVAAGGAKLAIADINQEALDKITAELKSSGVDVVATKVNVASNQEVDDWINSTVKHFGKLDGAANIAGVEGKKVLSSSLVDLKNEEWDYIMSINLTGLMYCLRAELRVMGKGGAIVNAASTAGLRGRPGLSAYTTSKHGVVGLTKTAAKEAGELGIRVNGVAPGPIETPMLDRLLTGNHSNKSFAASYSTIPLQRRGQAEEVANLVTFLLSDKSSFMTGTIVPVDGGMTS